MAGLYVALSHAELDSDLFRRLTGAEIKVYLLCRRFADFSTGRFFVSSDGIARRAGISRRWAVKCILKLIKRGLLEKTATGGGRHSSSFVVRGLGCELEFTGAGNQSSQQAGTTVHTNDITSNNHPANTDIEKSASRSARSKGARREGTASRGEGAGAPVLVKDALHASLTERFLSSVGVKGSVPQDVAEILTLNECQTAWALPVVRRQPQAGRVRYFVGILKNMMREKSAKARGEAFKPSGGRDDAFGRANSATGKGASPGAAPKQLSKTNSRAALLSAFDSFPSARSK